ncbi:hypothetical protein E3P94_02000 [Wallemia ichthyophaga]|nr:hypothetical protein E3P95_01614 [Wallemia ichthyophaga]TIB01010.1 hypothetical protein E3P94_02000 [Wallemia ichthyophaga]
MPLRTSRRLLHLDPQSTEEDLDLLGLDKQLNIVTPRKNNRRQPHPPNGDTTEEEDEAVSDAHAHAATNTATITKPSSHSPSPKRKYRQKQRHSRSENTQPGTGNDNGNDTTTDTDTDAPNLIKKQITPEKKKRGDSVSTANNTHTHTRTLRNSHSTTSTQSTHLTHPSTRAALVRESTFGENRDTNRDTNKDTNRDNSGVFKTPSKTPKTPSRTTRNSLKKQDTFDEYIQQPKTLFKELAGSVETETATHTPSHSRSTPLLRQDTLNTLSQPSNIYATARNAIRSMNAASDSDELVGRDEEIRTIRNFIDPASPHSSLYVSGPPGGGKTAAVRLVTRGMRARWLNCMTYSGDGLLEEVMSVGVSMDRKSDKDKDQPRLVILDEIDTLAHEHLLKLFQLFQNQNSSHTKLIGIANALDLTSNQLQNLAHPPVHLQVHAYTSAQLAAIVDARLGVYRQLFISQALELLGRKVGAQTGDLRQVISVLTLALDSVEKEQRRSKGVEGVSQLTLEDAPRVTMPVMLKSISVRVTSAQKTSRGGKLAGLNLYARIALLCVMLTMKRRSKLRSRVGLYEHYCTLLRTHSTLNPTTKSDFIDLVNVLVSASIVVELAAPFDQNRNASDALLGTPSKRARNRAVAAASEPEFGLQYSEHELIRLLGVADEQHTLDDPLLEQLKRVYWGECRRIDAEAVRLEWSKRTPLGENNKNTPVDVFV